MVGGWVSIAGLDTGRAVDGAEVADDGVGDAVVIGGGVVIIGWDVKVGTGSVFL